MEQMGLVNVDVMRELSDPMGLSGNLIGIWKRNENQALTFSRDGGVLYTKTQNYCAA